MKILIAIGVLLAILVVAFIAFIIAVNVVVNRIADYEESLD